MDVPDFEFDYDYKKQRNGYW